MKRQFSFGNNSHNQLGINESDDKYVVHDIDLTATNDSHAIIVNAVLSNNSKSKRVLDVGCNTGSIGNELIKHGYVVDGIEYSKNYYDKLLEQKTYNNLYNISVSDFNTKGFMKFYDNEIKYDYILFADVLEHLVNPEEVIYKLSSKLNKNGKIIISIPNIAHIDIIINLLNGRFNYSKEGLLDNTHLRFFTKESFIHMIDNIEKKHSIDYSIKEIGQTRVKPEYISEDELKLFNIDNKAFEELLVIQNIFELSISNKKEERKVNNKDYYIELINEYNKVLNDKKELENNNNKLKQEINKLTDEHNSVINSRWWKLRNKLLFWKK